MTALQTYTRSHLQRQRDAHARADGYGRHRHLYLQPTIRRLATGLSQNGGGTGPSWLDYGCGKGGFIDEIRPLGLFDRITGFDPAVDAFAARPAERHDLVTCLDVLDVIEPRYLSSLLSDMAGMTGAVALLDVLTRPRITSTLRPHPAFYWSSLVRQTMTVVATRTEFPGMDQFERVLILAVPNGTTIRPELSGILSR